MQSKWNRRTWFWYFCIISCWNKWWKCMWAGCCRGRGGYVGGRALQRGWLWKQMPLPLPWHCWPIRWATSSSPWLSPHTASPPLPEPPPAHTHTLLLAPALPGGRRSHARLDGHHGRRASQLQWRTCHRYILHTHRRNETNGGGGGSLGIQSWIYRPGINVLVHFWTACFLYIHKSHKCFHNSLIFRERDFTFIWTFYYLIFTF